MPLDFPSSPTNGQYYNGFVYNSANGTWDSAYAPRAATIPISSPNVIINGAFDIWQRGTSISPASGYGYGPDRWRIFSYAANSSTLARQTFTPGAAPVDGYEGEFFMRVTATNNRIYLTHPVENVRTFAGQTVTLSFWAKAAATHAISVGLAQNFGTGGSAEVTTAQQNLSVTTAWQRFTVTFNLPSISGKTVGANSYLELIFIGVINNALDLWGVQLEAGAAATDFRRNAPSIQAELAACQRYYYRTDSQSSSPYSSFAMGLGETTNRASLAFVHPVTMRVKPHTLEHANTAIFDGVNVISSPSAVTLWSNNTNTNQSWIWFDKTSSITISKTYFLLADGNTSGYVAVSAEL